MISASLERILKNNNKNELKSEGITNKQHKKIHKKTNKNNDESIYTFNGFFELEESVVQENATRKM